MVPDMTIPTDTSNFTRQIDALMRGHPTVDIPSLVDHTSHRLRIRETPANIAPLLDRLLTDKLDVAEIGARGGLSALLKPHAAHLDTILCECDPAEAEALRRKGHRVVDRLIAGDERESQPFHITRNPRVSSAREPRGRMLPFIAGATDPDPERFDVVKTLDLPTTTIDALERRFGCRIAILRLDTQGTEYEILEGMQDARPLIIETEVSLAELYVGQALFYDIGRLLTERGYVIFDLLLGPYRAPHRSMTPAMRRMPLHGDAYFMPDWTGTAGLELIRARPRVWAATLLIYGLYDLLVYLLEGDRLPDDIGAPIREALHPA